jgi:hypothetical protein
LRGRVRHVRRDWIRSGRTDLTPDIIADPSTPVSRGIDHTALHRCNFDSVPYLSALRICVALEICKSSFPMKSTGGNLASFGARHWIPAYGGDDGSLAGAVIHFGKS